MFGKRVKADVNGQRYLFKKKNDIYEPTEPSKLEKKIISLGLIPAILWIYSGSNLFGKTKDTKDTKQNYEQIEKYVPNKPDDIYNTSNLERLVETPVPANSTIPAEVIKQIVYDNANKFKGWKYDLSTNKLVPYSEEKNNNSATQDNSGKTDEIKKDKKGLSTGAIVGIVLGAAALSTGAYFLLKGKKSDNNNGPTPDNPDLTVECYKLKKDGSLESVPNAQVQIGSNNYNAINGKYTAQDIGSGAFEVNFTDPSVWNEILFVRDGINSNNPNIEQRDFRDFSSPVTVNANRTVYLMKLDTGINVADARNYLDNGKNGMYKVNIADGGALPVIKKNIWGGDISEAVRILEKNTTNINNATHGRLTLNPQTTDASGTKMDVELKDITSIQSTHGEDLNGYKITYAILNLPGRASETKSQVTLSEIMGGAYTYGWDSILYILKWRRFYRFRKSGFIVVCECKCRN